MDWLTGFFEWIAGVPSWNTPDVWSAMAAWVGLLLAAAAAVFAGFQLLDARRVRRETSAPYVLAELQSSEANKTLLDFVIRNIGQTPAFDVRIDIDPPMERADEIDRYHFMDAKPIRDGIAMLAPGQELRMHFDDVRDRAKKPTLPNDFTIRISGRDSRGRAMPNAVYVLDAQWGINTVHVDVHNLHWLATRVEGIEKSAGKIAAAIERAYPREQKFRDPAAVLARAQRGQSGETSQ